MAKPKGTTLKRPKTDAPGAIVGEANGFPLRRLKLSDIDPSYYNPREITERALEGLGGSVRTFGLVQFLVWNVRTRRLVGGHQRLKALAAEGKIETDVVQVDLDELMEKALNAELNNRAIQGDFTASIGEILDEIEQKAPEVYGALALEDLRLEIPEIPNANPDDFPRANETTVKPKSKCPNCDFEF